MADNFDNYSDQELARLIAEYLDGNPRALLASPRLRAAVAELDRRANRN